VLSTRDRITWLAQWGLTLLVAALIVGALAPHRAEIAAVLALTPVLLASVSVAVLTQFTMNGVVLKLMFEHFGARVTLHETVVIGLMDSTLNYLPMKAGTVATGAVALKRYSVKISQYAAVVAGTTLINVWVCGALAGLLLLPANPGLGLTLILVPSTIVVILGWWGHSHSAEEVQDGGRVMDALRRAVRGLQGMFADRRLLARIILTNVVRLAAVSAQLYFSFRAVSTPITIADSIVIGGFATVLGRVSIIPGGLGFREGGIVAAATIVGIDPTIALAASVIDRAVHMLWLLILGLPSTIYITRTTTWRTTPRAEESQPDRIRPDDVVAGNVYNKYETSNPVAKHLVRRFRDELNELWRSAAPHSQLDVGCGEGVIAGEWARLAPDLQLTAVDLNDGGLRASWADAERSNLTFACADAMDLPYAEDEFDVVSAIEVLEHVADPERALEEMTRVARHCIIVSVPREPLWRMLNMTRGFYVTSLGSTPGHLHVWSKRAFIRLLNTAGCVREVRSPIPWTIALVDLQSTPEPTGDRR